MHQASLADPNRLVINAAPRSAAVICAATKPTTEVGAMPAKVSVKDRASVTAGFAKDVEAVNQYAAEM